MFTVLRLSYRNLTRQRKRNVILAIAIGFGFFVVSLIDGLTSGAVGNLEDSITQMTGGNVMIAGYEKVKSGADGKMQLVNVIRDRDYIQNLLDKNDIKYKSVSRYTNSMGKMLFNGKQSMTRMFGRDLTEKDLLESFNVVSGSLDGLGDDPNAIIISEGAAENLKVEVGDSLLYTTSTIYGQLTVSEFNVAAIFKGNSFIDNMSVYAHIETVNKLVDISEGGYSTFTIFLEDKKQQSVVAQKIEDIIRADGFNVSSRAEAAKKYPTNIGKGIDKQFIPKDVVWDGIKYGVVSLNDEAPQIQEVMSVIHMVTTIILLVILLIVMVGISNTYRMVLYERIREIGTMRALGMSGKDTGRVFTVEALLLCIFGAACGLIAAILVMQGLGLFTITKQSVAIFLHNRHISFKLSPVSILGQYVLMIVLTSLAVRGTAKKASRMNPAEALRTVK